MKCLFREPLYVPLSTAVERESDWYLYIQTQAWTTVYLHPRKQIYRTIYERELIVVIYLLLFALLS